LRSKIFIMVLHSSSSGLSSSDVTRWDAGMDGTPRNSRGVSPSSFRPVCLPASSAGNWVKMPRVPAPEAKNL
jgi:hypothetical protein